nr:MAG TPA: hypothetical protein [Caudoviricetes sp.]
MGLEGSHHNGAVAAHYRTGQADRAIARSVNERGGRRKPLLPKYSMNSVPWQGWS